MCSRTFVVSAPSGLHLRPATMLAKTAIRFECDIRICRGEAKANAKSLMGICVLEATCGTEVIIMAEGSDADDAMVAIEDLFATAFGE